MNGLRPSTPLTGYDPTKGVAIADYNATGNSGYGRWAWGFASGDWNILINGLQAKSTVQNALLGFNYVYVTNGIFDGGYSGGSGNSCGISLDVPDIVASNLILNHGPNGLCFKYGSSVALFNTIVNLGSVSNAVGISYTWAWVWTSMTAANNAVATFLILGSHDTGEGTSGL